MIRLLVEQWGDMPLVAVNAHEIETFLAKRKSRDGITQATANRYLALVKTMLKKAHLWGYVAKNHAADVKMSKEDPTIPEALSEKAMEALLEELPEHARLIATVFVETGLRKGELFRLLWQDIDFQQRWISVRQTKNNEFRTLPMSDRVFQVLMQLSEQKNGLFVFTHEDGTPRTEIREAVHNAGMRAGIGHITHHMFRHTFATRLRDRSVALDRIKDLLGHKEMTMTLRYAKTTPIQLRGAIAMLNQPRGEQGMARKAE